MVTIGNIPLRRSKTFSPKKILIIVQIVAWLAIIGFWVLLFLVVSRYRSLDDTVLRNLAIYPNLKADITQKEFLKDAEQKTTVDDIIVLHKNVNNQYDQLSAYYKWLQKPYEFFLQYFLLPPLNIWRDKYTHEVDMGLVWQRYLTNNSYLDVNLISQWTNFFKDIGPDSPKNEIKSIDVWTINEQEWGVFNIPIDVEFVAQTKRSFLLLVDKLSMTSNRSNISLLNEFFFNLWWILREKVEKTPELLTASGTIAGTGISDIALWQNMYDWVVNDDSVFITNDDIALAIRYTANCEDQERTPECYFKFREKMRTLPALAYTVGIENSNKAKELRRFLHNMPPVINVKSFTFQKQTVAAAAAQGGDRWYEWRLNIQVYGKSMTAEEVNQIATYLGTQCTNGLPLNPSTALVQLDLAIQQATSVTQISNEKSKELSDLRDSFAKLSEAYDSLSWFKKATKLFEIYRMLDENNLCMKK